MAYQNNSNYTYAGSQCSGSSMVNNYYNDDYCPYCHVYNKIWYQTPESFQEYFLINKSLKLCFNCANKKLQRLVSIRETRNKLGKIRKSSIF